ncbi:MAG TPA: DUF4129 domain-containing protein [Candidatus Limnocylindrales bacterium]
MIDPSASVSRAAGRLQQIGDPLELVPVPLVILAEAAWISIVAGLVQEFVLRPPQTSIPELVAAVLAGLAAARVLGSRLGSRWPPVALVLVCVGGVVGWIVSPAARDALRDGIGPGLGANPGGFLVGVAVLRGMAHARFPLAEDTVGRLLAIGAPGIAIAAIVGGIVSDPYRTRFVEDTTVAAVVFVGSSVLAVVFTRLAIVGLGHGLDWRRNRAWLGLVIVVLAAAVVFALPVATAAGVIVAVIAGLALGPIFVIGLASGLDRRGRRIVIGVALIATVLYVIMRLGLTPNVNPAAGTRTGPVLPGDVDRIVSFGIGGLLAFLGAVAVLLLVAVWMRRSRFDDDLAVVETRTVDRSGEPTARRPSWRPHRSSDPGTAVAAYIALLRDLERHPELRREPSETPAEHAARVREAGYAGIQLDLLAADYALERDGGRALTAAEDRRGVLRWRRLRTALPAWSQARATAGAGPTLAREDRGPRPEAAREEAVPAGRQTG